MFRNIPLTEQTKTYRERATKGIMALAVKTLMNFMIYFLLTIQLTSSQKFGFTTIQPSFDFTIASIMTPHTAGNLPMNTQISSLNLSAINGIRASTHITHVRTSSVRTPMKERPVPYYLRKYNVNATLKSEKVLTKQQLDEKLTSLLSPLGHEKSEINSYSPENGIFESYQYFHATKFLTRMSIEERLAINSTFSDIHISEKCFNGTCSGPDNGECYQKNENVNCVCNIGFAGDRCSIAYAVDGRTYGPWSKWTECDNSCSQKRFRYCHPDPINGGSCLIGQNPLIESRICYNCQRKDDDNDYGVVAFVFIGLLILVLILLIAYCCTYKIDTKDSMRSSSNSYSHFGSTDFIRISPAFVNTPVKSNNRTVSRTSKKSKQTEPKSKRENGLPLTPLPYVGRYNHTSTEDQTTDDGEDLYQKQIKRFLKSAPGLSQLGPGKYTPESSNDELNETYVLENGAKKEKRQDRLNVPQKKELSFTPALNKRKEIQEKIIERGGRFQLVMV